MTAPRPHDPYAALRFPAFRWFILSLMALTVALQMQTVVVGWQVYAITHDPLSLGLVGLAEALPFIAVALVAGHVADRRDRRQVALVALAALLVCGAALLAFSLSPHLLARGRVWPIYVVVLFSGIARSFFLPARTALSAEIVPRELYPGAVAWRSSTWQFAAVMGPALGGLLYGFRSAAAAYGVAVVLTLIAYGTLVQVPPTGRVPAASTHSVAESLGSGIRFLRSRQVLLGAMTLDLFSVLFGGATALLPIFAADILHVGPQGLGVLRAAPAAGAVLMSIVLAHRPPMRHAGRALLVAVGVFGLCMLGFGLSRSFALSIGLLALSGMVDNVSVVVRSTLVQVLTPEHLLGRVSALNQIFIGSSNEIGEFESGVAAKLIGVVPSVVVGATITLLVVAATAWRAPQLRRLREIRSDG